MILFPSRLRELRGSLSQDEMARKFGVSQVAYGRWERGKAEPKFEVVVEICKNFSVSADWLFGLSDERGGGVSVTATGGSAAAGNNLTATLHGSSSAEVSRLLDIIESQQEVIKSLAAGQKDG